MSTDPARLTDDEREDLWRAYESWTEGDFSEHMGEAVEVMLRGHLGELERLRKVVAQVETLAERLVYADCQTWIVDAVHDALGDDR